MKRRGRSPAQSFTLPSGETSTESVLRLRMAGLERDSLERRALMDDHRLQVAVLVAAAARAGRTYHTLTVSL